MKERKHNLPSDGLDALVTEIDRFVSQLPDGLNTKIHQLNFLREPVIKHQWADIAVLRAQVQKLTFPMLVDSLSNCLQLHMQRMSNRTKTNFGQYLTNPADVQKHDHPRNNICTGRFQPRSYLPYSSRRTVSRYRNDSRDRSRSQSSRRFHTNGGNLPRVNPLSC